MGLVRYLQHWLGGAGPRLQVADFVPDPHPLRQWADTFPWAALVAAVEQSFATRFPKRSRRGHRRQDKAGCPSILHRYAARGTSSKLLVS